MRTGDEKPEDQELDVSSRLVLSITVDSHFKILLDGSFLVENLTANRS